MRIFWLLIIHVLLFAADSATLLERADTLAKSPSKTEVFRAYNDYKNVYLRAVMDADESSKQQALKGIVITGKKLHIDVSKYKNELVQLKPSATTSPTVQTKSDSTSNDPKSSELSIDQLHHLEDASWRDGKIDLSFDGKLLQTDVNYIKLLDKQNKQYRYIFDIHALMDHQIALKHPNIKRISASQYRYDTMRFVIETDKPIKMRFALQGKRLIINPHVGSTQDVTADRELPYTSNATQEQYKGKIVVLDPGHGGKDTGAIGYKHYREKIVVLDIAKMVAKRLRKEGIKVYLTRSNDHFIKLRKRTVYANNKRADLFVSIHANSVPKKNTHKAQGIETYFLSPSRSTRATRVAAVENSKEIEDMNYFGKNNFLSFLNREKIVASNKLAIDIQRGMLARLQSQYKDVKDNGVREGPFWVLVGAQMPAVLVEVGFLSHPEEAKRMVNKAYQNTLAEGMAEGILRYFINNP